jgi:hypothetical protein
MRLRRPGLLSASAGVLFLSMKGTHVGLSGAFAVAETPETTTWKRASGNHKVLARDSKNPDAAALAVSAQA